MSDFKPTFETLEFPRASSYTPAPGKEKERSSIGWSLFNGNPRITVWTRVDDDKIVNGKKQGPISAGIGHEYIEGVLGAAIELYKSGDVDVLIYDNMINPKMDDGSISYEKTVGSSLIFGRGEDGICYYGLKSADESRPVIMFQFNGFEWHVPRRRSAPLTKEELSTIHAVSMMTYIKEAMLSGIRGQTPEERKAISERRKAARNGGQVQSNKPSAATTAVAGGFDADFGF